MTAAPEYWSIRIPKPNRRWLQFRLRTLLLLMLVAALAAKWWWTPLFRAWSGIKTATLLSRQKYNDYENACFSFEHDTHDSNLTRNDYDVQFGNGGDVFSVDMVTDDCSRILDLGELTWGEVKLSALPELPAHPKPAREPSVPALPGHVYMVHTKDRDTDQYVLFRVESLAPGDHCEIMWSLLERSDSVAVRPAVSTPPAVATPLQPKDAATPTEEAETPAQDVQRPTGDADAMTLYRRSQELMKAGKQEEGYETAKKAMQQFIAKGNRLAWMKLESIPLKDRRIDVHFNMGPTERDPPEDGIVRPLSFRVWSTGADQELLETIDFEIGRLGGKSVTAAIGKMEESAHLNFGILPVDASYEAIKKAVLDVVLRNEEQSE